MDGYGPPTAGVLNSTWVSPDTLVVEGFVKTFCGGAAIAGDYRVNGNDLILVYSVKPGLVVTTCNCVRKVVYRISNLPRQNYLISITPDKWGRGHLVNGEHSCRIRKTRKSLAS